MKPLSSHILTAIALALQAPARSTTSNETARIVQKVRQRGVIYEYEVEDWLYATDGRAVNLINRTDLLRALEYRFESYFPRPSKRARGVWAHGEGLALCEGAAALIELEKLGFDVDAAKLIDLCRLEGRSHLTDHELAVLWYEKEHDRCKWESWASDNDELSGTRTVTSLTLKNGYRVRALKIGQNVNFLQVRGAKYRSSRSRP